MPSLGRNILANLIGRVWTTLLGILFVPLYLKFMGIEAYGLVGFFATLQGVLGLLDLGIGSTMNREIARLSVVDNSENGQRDLVRTLESLYWGIAIFGGCAIYILAPFIAQNWIQTQDLSSTTVLMSVRLMGVAVALQFPFSLYQGGLMGLQRQVLVNIILVVTGTLRSAGAVLVLWLVSPTIETFFVWQVTAGLISSAVFFVAMWRCLPKSVVYPRFRSHILRNVWKYAAAISANALIGVALTQLDKVILSKMLPLKAFAYYSLASTVASAVWMLIIPINNAVFPKLVSYHETKQTEELRKTFHLASQILIITLIPISLILTTFTKEILMLWTKNIEIVENAYIAVILLVIGSTINGIASLSASAIMAFGRPQLITKTNLFQAIFIVPMMILAVSAYGITGAATVWILLNCAYMLIMSPIVITKYLKGDLLSWIFSDNVLPITAMLFASILLRYFIILEPNNFYNLLPIVFVWLLVSITGLLAAKEVRRAALNLVMFRH